LLKCLNTGILNPGNCLRHFSTLFTKGDKGLLLNDVEILGLDHIDELDGVL
jgi:hypothetical protein